MLVTIFVKIVGNWNFKVGSKITHGMAIMVAMEILKCRLFSQIVLRKKFILRPGQHAICALGDLSLCTIAILYDRYPRKDRAISAIKAKIA